MISGNEFGLLHKPTKTWVRFNGIGGFTLEANLHNASIEKNPSELYRKLYEQSEFDNDSDYGKINILEFEIRKTS